MDPKEQKPQDVKPTPAPVKQGHCATHMKDYERCLESIPYYWTSCKNEREAFKACPEFNSWVQSSVKEKKQQ